MQVGSVAPMFTLLGHCLRVLLVCRRMPFAGRLLFPPWRPTISSHLEQAGSLDELFKLRLPHIYLVRIEGGRSVRASSARTW